MRKRTRHQLFAFLLAICLIVGLFPPAAAALTPASGAPTPASLSLEEVQRLQELRASDEAMEFTGPYSTLLDGLPSRAADATPRVDARVMEALTSQDEVSVIIRLKEQPDLVALSGQARAVAMRAERAAAPGKAREVAHAARVGAVVDALQSRSKASQRAVEAVLAAQAAKGLARDVKPFWIINGFAATVSQEALASLAEHPDVANITLDETFTLPELEGGPKLPTWGLEKVAAPQVWGEYGFTGKGIVVGVMDSGVDGGHPALRSSYRGRNGDHASSWYVATDENYPTPADGNGHGTHVAGSIVGGPPGEVIGVAPGAQWIAAKIFRDSGSTSTSIILDAFQWMMAPGGDPAKAPHIVNNSWGSSATNSTLFWDAVEAWVAAGIFPAFANGNDGPGAGTVGSPGSYPHAFGVGATDRNDVIASFSSRGPAFWDGVPHLKPQVSAPGHQIYSAWPRQLGRDYHTISGTSMATPHLSGVVALLLEASPDLRVDQIRELLEETARWEPHMGSRPNNNYGYGIVDAYAAITAARYSGTLAGVITGPEGPVAALVAIPELGMETVSDPATGAYELLVKEGARQVHITAFGYKSERVAVTITGQERTTLDLALEMAPIYQISGLVRSSAGPVAGARVELLGTPLPPVETDAAGQFTLAVPEGEYTLNAQARGYLRRTEAITVRPGLELDLLLTPNLQSGAPGWSQYQNNPARTGFTEEELAASALRPLWQSRVSGQILFSNPVIAGGRIFIATSNGNLHALSLTDGQVLWSVGLGGNLRATPAVLGETVYMGGGDSERFYALDAATGQPVWTFATPGERLTYAPPLVTESAIYFGTGWGDGNGGHIYALDPITGVMLWKRFIGGQIFFGPALEGGVLYAGSYDARRLVALDAATGEEIWALTRTQDGFAAAPSVAGGVLYAGTTNFDTGAGSVLAVDAATGTLLWEQAGHGDASGNTPVIYGDMVILGSNTNNWVAAYDRVSGERIWRHSVGARVSSSQLVTADGLLIGGSQEDQRVWALDAYTGQRLWERQMANPVTSSPAVDDGTLILADRLGHIHAYIAPGTVTGTVTGPGGPLAARVRVRETGISVMADPVTGAYTLEHKPGSYTLEVYSYGYKQVTASVRIGSGHVAEQSATLEPGAPGVLAGQITDASGAPLSGVIVSLPETPLPPVTTDADGRYAFPELIEGAYHVELRKPSYVPATGTVVVAPGAPTVFDRQLSKYDIAVLGDYDGQIAGLLQRQGYNVESTSYAAILDRPGDYRLIIANGAQDDPGEAIFTQFMANADAAGVSILFLNQWGVSYGAIRQLSRYTGNPAEVGHQYNVGRVYIRSLAEHPLTAGLTPGQLTEVLPPNGDHSWFSGYTGHLLAEVHNDRMGRAGYGIGYEPRSTSSVHVLLSLHGAAPWSHPGRGWMPITRQLFLGAVTYGMEARFGQVAGQVTAAGEEAEPLAATVTVLETGERSVASADGQYRLLLAPGAYTLRFERVGYGAEERAVTVEAEGAIRLDVSLTESGLGALSGQVTSARTGGPLTGASVQLIELEREPVTTGEDGRFLIADVPAGTYTLEVSAPLHMPVTVAGLVVEDGAETVQDAHLMAAPRVAVVGDYRPTGNPNVVTRFLNENHVSAEPVGWEVMSRLDDFDVLLFNDPTDPGRAAFLAHLEAMEAAGVSAIFTDGYLSVYGAGRLLRNHLLDPEARSFTGSNEGAINFLPLDQEHPLFRGLSGPVNAFSPNTRVTYYSGYSGFPLADLSTGLGLRGMAAGYEPTSATGIRMILSGFAATSEADPYRRWTEEGRQLFLNAIHWAAAPGLATLMGTVQGPEGQPLAEATLTILETGRSAISGADGSYQLFHPAGSFTLEVAAFGFDPQQIPVTLTPNGTVDLTVAMGEGTVGRIAGTVRNREGQPVAGARVTLPGYPNSATTADDGSFALERIFPGQYLVQIDADGYVRHMARNVSVEAGEVTALGPALRASPKVAVIDDYQGRLQLYLRDWGYEAEPLIWSETSRVGDFDLIIANLASFPYQDPGPLGWVAFQDAVNRAHVPVIWMDQFGRGSIRFLNSYDGDPLVRGEGRSHGNVYVRVLEEHPLLEGFAVGDRLPVTEPGREYGFFTGYSGHTVGSLVTDSLGERGGAVAYRGRTSASVDILLSTLSVSTYGHPATPDRRYWTPEAERLLHNALGWALDAPPLAAEVRGAVQSSEGGAIASRVTVAETGRSYSGRAGDGTFFVPLQPGTWTLEISAFGHRTEVMSVTVTAGQVERPAVTLIRDQVGVIRGQVTDASGTPLSGALVEIEGTPLSAQTDTDGGYRFLNVPAGPAALNVFLHGYQIGRSTLTVEPDGDHTANFHLPEAIPVAIVGDYQNSLKQLLEANGFLADQHTWASVQLAIPNYRVLILNGSGGADPGKATFEAVLAAAQEAQVSVILASQFSSGTISTARTHRNDPTTTGQGFSNNGYPIYYRPLEAHPIFAGFPVGEAVPIAQNPPNGSQQYQFFSGYSGSMLAVQGRADGGDLGGGVAFKFTSARSVELLLGSLAASSYAAPNTRWTPEGIQIYLNAVTWAATARLGEVYGLVASDGQPVPGALVTVMEAGLSDRTAIDGSYSIGLGDGVYTLRVEAHGYYPAEQQITLEEDQRLEVNFELMPLPRGGIAGQVTDAGGSPIAGARVMLDGPVERSAVADSEGRFRWDDLLEGDYIVAVSAIGYVGSRQGATVVAGEVQQLLFALHRNDVAVVGDADGALTRLLQAHSVAAEERGWDLAADIGGYSVVIINGGEPTEAQFQALVGAADAAQVSLIFTGTWGVNSGGIRLLERFTDDVVVGGQGYREGAVSLTGFDAVHPLFSGLSDPAVILAPDSYYSYLSDYVGFPLASLAVGTVGELGIGAAYDFRSANHLHLVLSAHAATGMVGPEFGWTADGAQVLLNAVQWARSAQQPLPGAPVLDAPMSPVATPEVRLSGRGEYRTSIAIFRDGALVGTAEPGRDGLFSVTVALEEGENSFVAVASNHAGQSAPSDPVTVVLVTQGPVVEWLPADGQGFLAPSITVYGRVTAPAGVEALLINGQPVSFGLEGTFSVALELAEGPNLLTVTAVDGLGLEFSESRTVAYLAGEASFDELPERAAAGQLPVRLRLTDLVADSVQLEVYGDGGALVGSYAMELLGHHYQVRLSGISAGEYRLRAILVVEGWSVTLPDQLLRLR